MKKFFEEPEIKVIGLDVADVILYSGDYELGEDELPPF